MLTMVSAVGSITFVKAICVFIVCRYVKSTLIVRPTDADAVVGGTTFFNSTTSLASAEVHWFHYAVGDNTERSFIYGYGQFYAPYLGRFQLEKNPITNSYDLVIPSVTIADAGKYECQDETGRGDKGSAELTVLEEVPVCQSNMKPEGYVGPNICGIKPEELHLTCAVKYHGNQGPVMRWMKVGSDNPITNGVTGNASSDRAIYHLNMEVDWVMDGSSYQCQTTKSATSQYGCTSDTVKLTGTKRSTSIILIILGFACGIAISAIIGCKVGQKIQRRRQKKQNGRTTRPTNDSQSQPLSFVTEQVVYSDLTVKEANENLTTDNKRLTEKVTELERLLYTKEKTRYRKTNNSVNVIKTKANAEMHAPVTGIAILGNSLFVVSRNYRDIEVYDAETFVFERFIQVKGITNPLDIASSREMQCLYIINRQNCNDLLVSAIIKVAIDDKPGGYWLTENDEGRLSTYESNLVVCFSSKRVIVEYSSDGKMNTTLRLSPTDGFHRLWHAIKFTGTRFVVCHSKEDDRQRVCVVENTGRVLMAFEELPGLKFRMNDPIYLTVDREKSLFVADSERKRVLLFSMNLNFKAVLLETSDISVRLCLNESKDRVFIGVNGGEKAPETWRDGRILIYNITK